MRLCYIATSGTLLHNLRDERAVFATRNPQRTGDAGLIRHLTILLDKVVKRCHLVALLAVGILLAIVLWPAPSVDTGPRDITATTLARRMSTGDEPGFTARLPLNGTLERVSPRAFEYFGAVPKAFGPVLRLEFDEDCAELKCPVVITGRVDRFVPDCLYRPSKVMGLVVLTSCRVVPSGEPR